MSAERLVIVDTGGANIASLVYAFKRLGVKASVSAEPADITAATHVVLPGVGAAGDAMKKIGERNLQTTITTLQQPVLGICLGMHLLSRHSVEQDSYCLGLLSCDVEEIPVTGGRAVPHMGWNQVTASAASPLTRNLPNGAYFYFVHTYAVPMCSETIASYEYGDRYAAIVQIRNFFGCQFHPERSAENGEILLRNFLELPSCV